MTTTLEAITRASVIKGVREDDPDRWREFYAIYKPMLLSYFRRQGLADGDAHDLAQDVFVKLLRKIQTYDRTRTRFRTWLFTIARHALIDRARRLSSQRKAIDGWVERVLGATSSDEEQERRDFERSHHRRILRFAFETARGRCSERVWACFELSVVQNRPGSEVAAELGMSRNAVYVNSWRVLRSVKELCRRYDEDLRHEPEGQPA